VLFFSCDWRPHAKLQPLPQQLPFAYVVGEDHDVVDVVEAKRKN
jgi:hypothetical protein